MLKNYLKIAWRNLTRNKSYAFINIGGLAVALAVFIVIMLFVRHELSYDKNFTDSGKIYRVLLTGGFAGQPDNINPQLPEPIIGELKQLYPEIEQGVRVNEPYGDVLLEGKTKIYTKGWSNVGTDFFTIFDFKFIAGNPATALSKPYTVVITKGLAQKLFGQTNVIGKTITHSNSKDYKITGVLENLPTNTHFNMSAFAYRSPFKIKKWTYRIGAGYIKLKDARKIDALRKKMPAYIKNHKRISSGSKTDFQLTLQPLTDIHLHPSTRKTESTRLFYIQILIIVAGLILLVACINYMNMATARSAGRAREIGIRKTVGAHKKQVMMQVMIEAGLTCFFSFILAFGLVELFKPLALHYFDISVGSLYHFTPAWGGFIIGLIVVVSLLSGAYAAFYLSSFQPTEVLKGTGISSGRGASQFRKILVVAQFSISIAIVIASLLIARQMEYVRTERLNGHDAQVMVIKNKNKNFTNHFAAFKNRLLHSSNISAVSAGTIPNHISGRSSYTDSTGKTTHIAYFSVKYDYLKTMGLKLVDGHNFDVSQTPDDAPRSNRAIILNQAAAKYWGYRYARGQSIKQPEGKLIGIVKDFHAQTLFDPIEPVVISLINSKSKYFRVSRVLVRLKKEHIAAGMDDVQVAWNDFSPAYPMDFNFLDRVLDQDYKAELRLGRIFDEFSVFAVLIACLGLFGLAAFAAERRTKEIGVRKVLGATVANIVGLLSKDFIKLVVIDFVIAVPLAWYAMHRWLQSFAYKTKISPGIFLLAGGVALLIALATVSWQSIRAALANPVDSLRSE